jgi:hypothetical protein
MPQRIKDRLLRQARKNFVGRAKEMATLLEALEEEGALVTFVYGIGGIGKSSLRHAFELEGQARGVKIISLDCRTVQPSEKGLLEALSQELGEEFLSVEAIAEHLGQYDQGVILTLDTYELFRLMDTWLRQIFIPALPDNVRSFFFGREAPVSAWLTTPGWQGLFRSFQLDPLDHQAAIDLLIQAEVDQSQVERINHFANGHPLALKLAAAAIIERPDLKLEDGGNRPVVEELARIYLKDIPDPRMRQLLEAASVIRRTTRSLLSAMLPDLNPQEAYDRLGTLPFVESSTDGLIVHDTVRHAVEVVLRASDPSQYHTYRRLAWQRLRTELNTTSRPELWRYTADTIYLIQQPTVRDAFFPNDAHLYAIEQAQPVHQIAIHAITERHDGPASAKIIGCWSQHLPGSFFIVRGSADNVAGYYALSHPEDIHDELRQADPIVQKWSQHLQDKPLPTHQNALFMRRILATETGEALSGVQAACWLDVKRTYVANPRLGRMYVLIGDTETYLPIMEQLGFRLLPDMRVMLDGTTYDTVTLDFGPRSIIGWMAGLVDAQYGFVEPEEEPECRLDTDARELVVEGHRVGLTPLEFGVMQFLHQRQGKAVSRVDLLEEVWGFEYDGGGSNVVDAVIRSLRKKLNTRSSAIKTVPGVGYRFQGF